MVHCDFPLQGADLNGTDCKGNTPLLLATSCGAWRTVSLLLSKGELLHFISPREILVLSCKMPVNSGCMLIHVFMSLGANVNVKDRCGCNFLHLAILQPKGLKNLSEEVLQVHSVLPVCDSSDSLYAA